MDLRELLAADPASLSPGELRAQRLLRMDRERRQISQPLSLSSATPGEDGLIHVGGYSSVFDVPFEVFDWLGSYTEIVMHGAFTKTLAERDDIRFLINHEGLPLARTKSATLQLEQDDIGLKMNAGLEPSDPDVQALVPKLDRGDVDQQSIGFQAKRQEWNEDYTERKLLEVKLWDVSAVTFPASPTTSIGLRGLDIVRALAETDPDELLVAARSATDLGQVVGRAREVLDALGARRGATEPDAGGNPVEVSDPAPAPGERDAASTMDLDEARRRLELIALG